MANIKEGGYNAANSRQIKEEIEELLEPGQINNQLTTSYGNMVKEEEVEVEDEQDVKPSLEELENPIIPAYNDDAFPSMSTASQKPPEMVLPKEEEVRLQAFIRLIRARFRMLDIEIKEEAEERNEILQEVNGEDVKIGEEPEEYEEDQTDDFLGTQDEDISQESEQDVQGNNSKKLKRRPAKRKMRLKCETCGKICAGSWILQRHQKTHLDDNDPEKKTFKCEICPRAFLERKQLQQHKLLHLDNEEERRPFKCLTCGKRFSQRGGLTVHMQTHLPETEKIRHVCDICEETFAHKGYLSTHKRIHLNKDQLPYVCDVCGQKFSISGNLRMHKFRKHNPKREEIHKSSRLKCDECGKTFAKKKALEVHKQSHQNAAQPMKCGHCGRRYLQQKALAKHELSHRPMPLLAETYEETEEHGSNIKTEYDTVDVKDEVQDEMHDNE